MKTGILYTVSGSVVLAASIGLVILAIIPFEGTEPHLISTISRIFVGAFIGLWLLPRGLLRIREAKQARRAKRESQTH